MLDFNHELSNVEITDICNRLGIKLNGIYMRDELTKSKLRNGNYIINLDSAGGNGTHWTAFIKHNKNIYYCDSFGVQPPQEEITVFHQNQDHIFFNDTHMQDIKSVMCGYYCIAFFLFMKVNKQNIRQKLIRYSKLFTKNTKQNDNLIKNFILSYYK